MSGMNLTRLLKKYKMKNQITMVTAWDAMTAKFIEKSKVDCLLVGDSLTMTALGHSTTIPLTLEEMIHHTKAVCRVAKRPFVISDLPFSTMSKPIDAAIDIMQAGAKSIKMEGVPFDSTTIPQMLKLGIPVLGHLGLNPQHVNQLGGFKIYKNSDIVEQAKVLEGMGCWGIVIEAVPSELATMVQEAVNIPLIGIGAGILDGQVLVFSDLLGLEDKVPKFCKVMANAGKEIDGGLNSFCELVESKKFPSKEEEYN